MQDRCFDEIEATTEDKKECTVIDHKLAGFIRKGNKVNRCNNKGVHHSHSTISKGKSFKINLKKL